MVVRFARGAGGAGGVPGEAEKRTSEVVEGTALEGLLEVEGAARSLRELEDLRADAAADARASGTAADTSIDVRSNRVEVAVADVPEAPDARGRALGGALGELARDRTDAVALTQTDALARPAAGRRSFPRSAMPGGTKITARGGYCTNGFSVRNAGGSGTTTAGHCPRRMYRGGFSGRNLLPIRAQRFSGGEDVQWHATPGRADRARIKDGRGKRRIRGAVARAAQPVGAWVCKYGARTGRTCGVVESKTVAPAYVPNARPVFVKVRSPRPVVLPGDSGGPVFRADRAWGTATAYSRSGNTHYGYYMPIDGLRAMGVRLVTAR